MSLGSAARCRNEGGVHSLSVENEWCVSCLLLCPVLWSPVRSVRRSCRSIACLLTRGPRNSADSWQSRKWRSSLGNRVIFLLLYAVYGNVEDEGRTDGRTRSCVNSAVLHDGWESSAAATAALLRYFPLARNLSRTHSLTPPREMFVRLRLRGRPLLISLAHCERGG